MSIRIKGANRRYTSEIILERAIGMVDEKYHTPLEIIHLEWTPYKRNYHQTKTKGFEDTFLTRLQGKGIVIEHRVPGSAEWLKDGLTGRYVSMLARTEHNMYVLASMYYDKLWTIKEAHIDMIVKKKADEIDEANRQTPYTYEERQRILSDDGKSYKMVTTEVTKTMYDFHKARREAHFKTSQDEILSAPINPTYNEQSLKEEHAQMEKKRMSLEEREARVEQRENNNFPLVEDPKQPVLETKPALKLVRDGEKELNALPIGELRKKAKAEYGVEKTFTMKKSEIVSRILQSQKEFEKVAKVTVEEEETETVVC